MNSSGTEPNGSGKAREGEPKIDAVCLIPEPRTMTHMLDKDRWGVEVKIEALMKDFASRFTYPFYLTTRCGLVRLGESWKVSERMYGDLTPEERHVFLNALRGQLTLLMCNGRPCVCLVGGVVTQGLRRLDLDFHLPLSSMSQRQRREWLKARQAEEITAIWRRLWGRPWGPDVQSSASFVLADESAATGEL